jgi:hypothetical protein
MLWRRPNFLGQHPRDAAILSFNHCNLPDLRGYILFACLGVQVRFYQVSETELEDMREKFKNGQMVIDIEQKTFSMGDYNTMVEGEGAGARVIAESSHVPIIAAKQDTKCSGYMKLSFGYSLLGLMTKAWACRASLCTLSWLEGGIHPCLFLCCVIRFGS